MSGITLDALTPNETVPTKSRTFSPEVVAKVYALFHPTDGTDPARNVGVGTFEKEGGARSALTSLNKLLKELHNVQTPYASTVRVQEDGQYRAILLNRPAKARAAKEEAPAAEKPKAAAKS
jgi:hypothetical protein